MGFAFFFSGPAFFQSNLQEPIDSDSPCKKKLAFLQIIKGLLLFDTAVDTQVL